MRVFSCKWIVSDNFHLILSCSSKYLCLPPRSFLFSLAVENQVDLAQYVFNTEAHPLKMFDYLDQQEHQQQPPSFGIRGAFGLGGQR